MRVVCGTTLGDECGPVGETAAGLAARLGATLHLVHVSEDMRAPVVLGTPEERAVLGDVRNALHAEGHRLASQTGVAVEVHLAAGGVADGLASVAEFTAASLLVVGPGVNARPPHVSAVVERIARVSTVPVLVVKDAPRLAHWLREDSTLRAVVGADTGRSSRAARSFVSTLRRAGTVDAVTVSVVAPGVDVGDSRSRLARLVDLADERIEVLPDRASPEARLAVLASEREADVVLVGQRARSSLDRVWSGSVSRGVLGGATTNVLCVPAASATDTAPGRAPDVVLVAIDVDDPDSAERALAMARVLVRPGGVLHVVHAVSEPDLDRSRARRERAWTRLNRLAERAEPDGFVVERHVVEGEPAGALISLAERVDAALIVTCSRRRSVLSRALVGSVARGLIDASRLPVVVVPPEAP